MSNDRVSLVIPTFNSRAFLPSLIASLELLDPEPFEVIFVDDCSIDGSPQTIDEILGIASLSCLVKVVLRDVNGGSSAARNDGLNEAKGDIVAFCDSDDLPLPHRIGVHQTDLANRSGGAVSYGAIAGFHHGQSRVKYVRGGWRYREGRRASELIRRNFVPFSTVAVSGDARLNHFRGRRYNEDWFYLVDLARKYDLVTRSVPLAVYRYSEAQKSRYFSPKELLGSYDELIQLYKSPDDECLARVASTTKRLIQMGGPVASSLFLYREFLDFIPSRLRMRRQVDAFLHAVHKRALNFSEN